MGIHRRSQLVVLGSLSLLVVTQVAIPTPASAAAATHGQPAQVSKSPSASQTTQTKTTQSTPVGPDGKPRIELRDPHFKPTKSKENVSLKSNEERFDNPDGTHTLRVGTGPLKGLDEAGTRGDLDLSLTNGKDGRLRPKREDTRVSIAPTTGAKMASVELVAGKPVDLYVDSLSSGVSPTRISSPLGETAHFDKVLPQGTSLELRALSNGVESAYVVPSAAAATGLVEHLTLPTGYAVRQAIGDVEILDEQGSVVGVWSGGAATDSSPHQIDTQVTLNLQGVQGNRATALVVLDPKWLADSARVYPVRIDPTVIRESTQQGGYGSTFVQVSWTSGQWNQTELRVGTYNGGADAARTLILYPIDGVPAHSRIVGATMWVYETWSWSCQGRLMETHRVPVSWPTNVTWWGQPGFNAGADSTANVAAGWSPNGLGGPSPCGNPGAWQAMDLSSLVADWYYGNYPRDGVLLKAADETDNYAWKRFAGTGTSAPPLLDITYESFGNQPIAIDDTHLQQPATVGTGYQAMTLTNQGSDTWPAGGPYQVGYHLYNSAGQYLHDGPATVLPTTVNPGGSITVNATIEALPMGSYTVAWDMLEQNVTWFSSVGIPTTNRSYRSNAPPTMAALQSPAPGYAQIPSAAFGAYPTSGSTTSYTASFEAWFKTTAGGVILGQTSNVLPPNTPSSGWVPALYVDSAGALRDSIFWHTNGSGNVAAGPYNDARPHHVVATYGNGVDSLYVDGSLVSSTSVNVTGFANTYAYLLGTGYTTSWANTYKGGWFPFAGTLDEVAVYNTALTLAQVQAHHGAATGTSYKSTILSDGPTAFYRMDDSPGASTLADSSGHSNPGTWSGGAGTSDPSLLSGDSDAAMGMGRAQVASATPTLSASSTDPDGDSLQYLFRICSGIDAESGACTDSGWISTSSWTVPAGKLSPGGTYYWHTWVTDGGSYGQVSPPAPYSLTVTLPSAQPAWSYGFDPYAAYHGGVNTAIGNYVYSNTDFAFPSVGPPIQLVRTYNSMDMAPNGQGRWFGLGWTSTFETSLAFDSGGNGTVTYPDGRREFLTSNGDGTYAPAFGFASGMSKVVVSGATYYDLKHRDQSVWRFNSSGTLVSMTDAYGHQLQLVWSSTAVTISDPSGRSLAVTFSAPLASAGRVTQVVSSLVTVGGSQQALKWTYTYDGSGQLASACDPTDTPSSRVCSNYTNSGPGNRLSSIVKPNGNGLVTLTYDTSNRVSTRKDGLNNTMTFNYGLPASGAPSGTVATTSATDAINHTTQSSYNNLNQLLQHINEDGSARTYTFDQRGFLSSITDENGNVSTYTNDTAGNVLQFKDGAGDVTYYAYDSANRRTAARDPRSSGPTDNTYLTTYAYDSSGNLISEATPAGTRTWSYSTGTEAAIAGGVTPPNMMLAATDAMGHATTYAYDSLGNPRRRTDTSGLVTDRSFDELGRELSRKETSDSYPSGLLTTTAYDLAGRMTMVTEPAVTNVVTSVTHQRTSTLAYDKNGNLTSVTVADATGGDPSRKTSYSYDNDDRQISITDPLNHTGTTTYDAAGNVIQVKDALGRVTSISYTLRNQPSTVKLLGFIDDPINPGTPRDVITASYTYDAGGRRLTDTDSLGRQTKYAYDQANRLTTVTQLGYHNRDNTTRDVVLETRSYDAASNLTRRVEAGLKTTDSTFDAAGRLSSTATYAPADGPTGARTTTYTYDANGNVLSRSLSNGGAVNQVIYGYDLDQGQRLNHVEVVNQGPWTAPNANQVTTYTYDQRGREKAMTEPRGNFGGGNPADYTTNYSYDEAGRLIMTQAPYVQVESGGGAATTLRPAAYSGYDTFGELTQAKDPRANLSTYTYDALGRRTGTAWPSYVTPGGVTISATESWQYDAVGNLVKWTDRRGQATTYDFDMRNRVVRQTDPLVSGQAASGVVRYAFDDGGNRTSMVDQAGARQQWSYDDLNRARTHTVAERVPAPTTNYTWSFDYDDLGRATYQATPLNEVTTRQYDVLGDVTQETDALGKVSTASYDQAGRLTFKYDPLNRGVQLFYDQAGNRELEQDYDPAGTRLAWGNWFWDVAGNLVGTSKSDGPQTTYSLDALGRLSSVTEPVSTGVNITTSFGYDASRNRTRVTDGNGHANVMTYNPWNLQETAVEPSTTAHPNATDRTWTWTYDPGGLPVSEAQPGGLTLSKTYDELGRSLQVTGGGVSNSYGWDLVGNRLSASSSGGGQSFAYNDRRQLVQATGTAGSSSFTYDGDGQPLTRIDATGSASFGWSPRGELTSVSEPLSGVQESLQYNDDQELVHIAYGASGPTRDYAYDGLGRLTSDVVKNPAATAIYQASYSYDSNSNLTQKILGAGQAGAGTHSYTYDWSNRLTSWKDPANNLTSYAWDGAGNRTQAGSQSLTYDERNRLVSGGGKTYNWSARGDLLSETSASLQTGYTYDGLGRLTQVQQTAQPPLSGTTTTGYAYDGLDRVAKRNSVSWSYAGTSSKPSSDGSTLFSRPASGLGVLATSSASVARLAVQGPHGDLEANLDSAGNLVGSFGYDPFGGALSGGTGSSLLGYQGEWTDPNTAKVWMAARWYDSGSARFLSRDSVQPSIQGSADTNLYAYGRTNPLVYSDPSGHEIALPWIGGAAAAAEGAGGVALGWVVGAAVVVAGAAWLAINLPTARPAGDACDYGSLGCGSATFTSTRAVDRWWEDTSTSTINTARSGTDTPTPRESGGGGQPGPWGAAGSTARSAVARVLTYLPAPALATNLGSGHLYLPTGAKVPTGLTSLPGATPWLPQDTGCYGCTELKSNGSGATSVPLGAFAQSATGDACGVGLPVVAPRPRVCLDSGRAVVEMTRDLACAAVQAALTDPNLADIVSAYCALSPEWSGGPGDNLLRFLGRKKANAGDPAARRVTLRKSTDKAIRDAALKTPDGDFIDPNTGKILPKEGPFDRGHKATFEWWRTQQMARQKGWTRQDVIEYENDPDHYQIEDQSSNRSHRNEQPR